MSSKNGISSLTPVVGSTYQTEYLLNGNIGSASTCASILLGAVVLSVELDKTSCGVEVYTILTSGNRNIVATLCAVLTPVEIPSSICTELHLGISRSLDISIEASPLGVVLHNDIGLPVAVQADDANLVSTPSLLQYQSGVVELELVETLAVTHNILRTTTSDKLNRCRFVNLGSLGLLTPVASIVPTCDTSELEASVSQRYALGISEVYDTSEGSASSVVIEQELSLCVIPTAVVTDNPNLLELLGGQYISYIRLEGSLNNI